LFFGITAPDEFERNVKSFRSIVPTFNSAAAVEVRTYAQRRSKCRFFNQISYVVNKSLDMTSGAAVFKRILSIGRVIGPKA
jgi:hypothetical protein